MTARRTRAPVRAPRRSRLSLAVALAVVGPGAAIAQTDGADALAADAADASELSRVVVEGEGIDGYKVDTASSPKFTAPIADTPKSVTIMPARLMQDTAATSLQDLLRNSPGITLGAAEGGQPVSDRPIIRGFNSSASVFVDGLRDIGTQTREVFNLDAVEIIKGADSAYAGRGSGGGSINLVSKTAQADDFVRGAVMLGTDEFVRATADYNEQLSETAALRLNVMGSEGNIPGRHEAVDFEKWGVAPSLSLGLGTPTRFMLSYYHLTDEGMPDYSIPYDPATGLPVTETLGVDRETFYGLAERDFRETTTDIGTLTFEHDFADGLGIRNVVRYGGATNSYVATNPDDSNGNVPHGLVWRNTKNRWSRTVTLANQTELFGEFATGGVDHHFDVGIDYSREELKADAWIVQPTVASSGRERCLTTPALIDSFDCTTLHDPNPYDPWNGTITRRRQPLYYTTKTMGVYAFDTLDLSERWQANLGLRWDRYDTELDNPTTPANNASSDDDFLNYQAGIVYKPVPAMSLYASLSTSTTPAMLGTGDDDRISLANGNLRPEESETLEIGSKWQLFDERLLLAVALFDSTRENANIEIEQGVFAQVGEAQVRGAELGVSGNITEEWMVFGGYSYLDSELVRGAFSNLAVGQPLPNVPEHSFSLFSTYQITPSITVGGGAYYVDELYGNAGAVPPRRVPDYWRFDAIAAWVINANVELQVNLQNLADETYYTKAYTSHYAALGPGRQLLVSANFTF